VGNPCFFNDAKDVARDRLEKYLEEKLKSASTNGAWEFYTFLLKQAQKHEIDCSYKYLYLPAFKADEDAADESWQKYKKTFIQNNSPLSDNSPIGEKQ